ncbi:MAG TPA: trehalose-phosphatase [Nevskiaceae bacterium]|nr:trehalose-phosphatase [Nevskiaceae bacterium]
METIAPSRSVEAEPPYLPESAALYLDFDGTLVDFAPAPDLVQVRGELPALLSGLHARQHGAVAVISGRRLSEVDRLCSPVVLAGAGVHGAELRPNAHGPTQFHTDPRVHEISQMLRIRFTADPRILIEDKGAAVALHFRLAPERGDECIDAMHALAEPRALQVLVGNKVVEARVLGFDKGHAIRMLAAQPPFAGRIPVFIGDDRTDEDGFVAAQALGGHGIKVGPGETAARFRCPDIESVHIWLRRSLRGDIF